MVKKEKEKIFKKPKLVGKEISASSLLKQFQKENYTFFKKK